jgi:hypothetical protein
MSPEAQALIAALRELMPAMTDEQRSSLRDALMDGYCPNCGAKGAQFGCQCMNDE